MSTKSKKVVALPSVGPALHVAVATGTAYDLVLTGLAAVDRDGQRRFDAGASWRDRARRVDAALPRRLDRVARDAWISLLGLAHESGGSRSASDLLATVEAADPGEVVLHLVGGYRRVMRRATPPEVIRAAVAGEPAAQREFRRTSFPTVRDWQATLRWALGSEPATVRDELLGMLRGLHQALAPEESTIEEAQARDGAAVAELATTMGPESLIATVAPGITYVPEVGQTEVVLIPATIIRPSVAVLDHRSGLLICYPVTADRSAADTPPERLVALGKAIGDETRLRVLRILRDGPLTGTELADRLEVPRTSLHYHLGLLRSAGLVEIAVDDTHYGRLRLRDEALGDLGRLLAAFVLDEHDAPRELGAGRQQASGA